jgi:hypothetical protein
MIHGARCARMICFGLVSLAAISFGAQRTVTVSGKVTDSVSGQPVADAMVLLFDTSSTNINIERLNDFPLDTIKTDAEGSFSKIIQSPNANMYIIFAVIKQKYSSYLGFTLGLSTVINLGTIAIIPIENAPKDSLTVSGKVVDAANGTGINQCLVAFTGADFDTAGKTTITNADGEFSKQIIVCRLTLSPLVVSLNLINPSLLGYTVYKEGYPPVSNFKQVTEKTVDLGAIVLSQNTSIRRFNRQTAYTRNQPATLSYYTLNGRLLYSGPMVGKRQASVIASNVLVVEVKEQRAVVGHQKRK